MHEELRKHLLEKYADRFMYLTDINSDKRPLPQQTVYNVLEPVIKELAESANVRPYKELLMRIKEFLDHFNINYVDLNYNNFYIFLKKRGIIEPGNKNVKKRVEKTGIKKENKKSGLLVRDPVDSLTDI